MMTSAQGRAPEDAAGATNSLDILRQIWRIPEATRRKESPPDNISTDIYHMPATGRRIPQRTHRKA
jgi:hypothetical protein